MIVWIVHLDAALSCVSQDRLLYVDAEKPKMEIRDLTEYGVQKRSHTRFHGRGSATKTSCSHSIGTITCQRACSRETTNRGITPRDIVAARSKVFG